MPRLSIHDEQTLENDPRDYCQHHYQNALQIAVRRHGDNVDDDCEHPPYEDNDGDPAYRCLACGVQLQEDDN